MAIKVVETHWRLRYGAQDLCGVRAFLSPSLTSEGFIGRAVLQIFFDENDMAHQAIVKDVKHGNITACEAVDQNTGQSMRFFAKPVKIRFRAKTGHLVQAFVHMDCASETSPLLDESARLALRVLKSSLI